VVGGRVRGGSRSPLVVGDIVTGLGGGAGGGRDRRGIVVCKYGGFVGGAGL